MKLSPELILVGHSDWPTTIMHIQMMDAIEKDAWEDLFLTLRQEVEKDHPDPMVLPLVMLMLQKSGVKKNDIPVNTLGAIEILQNYYTLRMLPEDPIVATPEPSTQVKGEMAGVP